MVKIEQCTLDSNYAYITLKVYAELNAGEQILFNNIKFFKNKLPNGNYDNEDAMIGNFTFTFDMNYTHQCVLDISSISNIDFSKDFIILSIDYSIQNASVNIVNSKLNTVIWDTKYIYRKMMGCLQEIEKEGNCNPSNNFLTLFLRYKAVYMAIVTNHYNKAIELYNKYFSGNLNINPTCNCHG